MSHPSASRTHVSSLPPQLLALVLARLEPAERLCTMARVCSAWRAAAVMATNSISARGRTCRYLCDGISEHKATALSDWLQTHAAAAAVDSLAVQGDPCSRPVLRLPVQQLASLRSLDLESIRVVVHGGADRQTATGPPDLPQELSGITRLRLLSAGVGHSTLPAFTDLQHLALTGLARDSSLELSGLVRLTHLHLARDCAKDAVLALQSGFTCLQELELEGISADGLAALPASLTKLCVSGKVTLAPDSTPAVAQLTALRWLEVNHAAGFSTAVLQSMCGLQHLAVWQSPLLSAADAASAGEEDFDEPRVLELAAFTALTQLQHLGLPVFDAEHAAAATETDVASLTASSQLTCLNINGLVDQQHYRKLFPEGRQLPQLKILRATMGLLGTRKDVEALVRCCPNLEQLDVGTALPDEPLLEVFDGGELLWSSVGNLDSLTRLTRLEIIVQGVECDDIFWRSMRTLTSLRDLHIRELHMTFFGGIVELTRCQQLTCLVTDCPSDNFPDFEMKTPEGQPPDVWRRLPREALGAALEYYTLAPNYGWDMQGALRSMARAAADHALDMECRHKEEVAELRTTVAGLESRLQQQEKQLQGFAGLQATVAAMGAQLQALLPKNSMQQGKSGIAD